MTHHDTLLSRLLSLIPEHVFQALEEKHKRGRSSRCFGFKQQFVVLAFIPLAAAGQGLYHLGWRSIARSTIAVANRDRPVAFFQKLFELVYQTCASKASGYKFRFKTRLFSLDSCTVSLCLSVFPWAAFRRGQAGIKMRTVLDHDGRIPTFVDLAKAKVHDSRLKKILRLPKGSIVVFDRGYNDYRWFDELTREGVFFGTRLKSNATHIIKVVQKELSLKLWGLE